jgi:hypothetical protein
LEARRLGTDATGTCRDCRGNLAPNPGTTPVPANAVLVELSVKA